MARFAHVLLRCSAGLAVAGIVSMASAPALAAPGGPPLRGFPAGNQAVQQPIGPAADVHPGGPPVGGPPHGGPPPPLGGPPPHNGPPPPPPENGPPPQGGPPPHGGSPPYHQPPPPPRHFEPQHHFQPPRHLHFSRLVVFSARAGNRHEAVGKARWLCASHDGNVVWVSSHRERSWWVGVVGCRI